LPTVPTLAERDEASETMRGVALAWSECQPPPYRDLCTALGATGGRCDRGGTFRGRWSDLCAQPL